MKIPSSVAPWVGGGMMYAAELTGSIPNHAVRQLVYQRVLGMKVAPGAVIYRKPELRAPNKISVGPRSIIGTNCILDGRSGITIGADVNLSSEVAIWTLQHDPQAPDFGTRGGPVVIEDHAWVSFRAVVLPGVTIGEGAVIAAGSIVTKDVEPWSIYAGTPAKKIGERAKNMSYELGKHTPFL